MVHTKGRVIELSITAMPVVIGDEALGVHGIARISPSAKSCAASCNARSGWRRRRAWPSPLFLANISHQVRTPLTSLLTATELFRETEMDPSWTGSRR